MGLNVMCTGGTGQKVLVDNTLGNASEYDIMYSFKGELFNSAIDVVMLNNKAYIFGSQKTYAFDGLGFTTIDAVLPRRNHRSCLTVHDGKILSVNNAIYEFDGERVTTYAHPYEANYLCGIASLNGELYIFLGNTGTISVAKLINEQWVVYISDIPQSIFSPDESILVTFNNKIYILGSKYSSDNYGWAQSICTFDGTNFTRIPNDLFVARGRVSVYDAQLHIMNPYYPYAIGGHELIINEDNTHNSNSYTVNNNSALALAMMKDYATRVKVNGEEYFLLLYGGIVAKKTANNNIDIVSLIAS